MTTVAALPAAEKSNNAAISIERMALPFVLASTIKQYANTALLPISKWLGRSIM
jgi:hypothetical protein